jgi:hypothetical protein
MDLTVSKRSTQRIASAGKGFEMVDCDMSLTSSLSQSQCRNSKYLNFDDGKSGVSKSPQGSASLYISLPACCGRLRACLRPSLCLHWTRTFLKSSDISRYGQQHSEHRKRDSVRPSRGLSRFQQFGKHGKYGPIGGKKFWFRCFLNALSVCNVFAHPSLISQMVTTKPRFSPTQQKPTIGCQHDVGQ